MKYKLAAACFVVGSMLAPVAAYAEDTNKDQDRANPATFVKDSAITAKIKTELAAAHITSLGRIHVDTDENGVVWLKGTARTQEAADKAVAVARAFAVLDRPGNSGCRRAPAMAPDSPSPPSRCGPVSAADVGRVGRFPRCR